MSGLFDWVPDLWGWIVAVFQAFKDLLSDIPILILDGILTALSTAINALPVPDFIGTSLASALSTAPAGVNYFVSESGVSAGLVIIGSGYAFRLLRKFLTLFQW